MAIHSPLTGYEPKQLDNFDYSETSAMISQDESGDIDTEPSYSCDAQLDDEIIRKALSSPLFIQEREEPANLRQAYHSHEERKFTQSFQLSPFSHTQVRRDPKTIQVRSQNENQVATWRVKESGFSLKDKKSKFSLKSELRSRNTSSKPILIEEVSRN